MTRLTRAFAAGDLQVRSDLRTITGTAVPFNSPTWVSDPFQRAYREQFAPGSFRRTIAERGPERVKLLAAHNDKALPIGRASLLREDPGGLYAELRVSRTTAGDEVLELVADGALDGLSIGFEPVAEDSRSRDVTTRTEVKLREISVVTFPAYPSALIAGVRGADTPDPAAELLLWQWRLAADYWSQ